MLLLIGIILLIVGYVAEHEDCRMAGAFIVVVGVVITIGVNIDVVIKRNEIAANHQKECVYQERIADLLPQIRAELATYPKHETAVYDKILKGGGTIFLSPQLRANETIMQAANEIKGSHDKLYALRISTIDKEARIRMNTTCGKVAGWVW